MVRARGLVVLTLAAMFAFACGGSGTVPRQKARSRSIGLSDLHHRRPVDPELRKFAIDQKNAAGGINGFTVTFQGFDDCRQGSYPPTPGSRTFRDAATPSSWAHRPHNPPGKGRDPDRGPAAFHDDQPGQHQPGLTKDIAGCAITRRTFERQRQQPLPCRTTDDYQGPQWPTTRTRRSTSTTSAS